MDEQCGGVLCGCLVFFFNRNKADFIIPAALTWLLPKPEKDYKDIFF